MKKGMKILCLKPEQTKGYLKNNGIYTVLDVDGAYVELVEVAGWYMSSRFKVMETPSIDNTLGHQSLDNHNAEKSDPPDERQVA